MLLNLGPAVAGLFIFPTTGESQCPSAWRVSADRDRHRLELNLREVGTRGPACDLVVQSFAYDETLELIDVKVQPARTCLVDALSERRAEVSWTLPQELRQRADLILVVNGALWGSIHLRGSIVAVTEACP